MNTEEKAMAKFNDYLHTYGVGAINLVIQRSKAAEFKRDLFRLRFNDNDEEREAQYTEMMAEMTKDVEELDNKLLMLYGIHDKLRTQMLRDLKKARGEDWDQELAEI